MANPKTPIVLNMKDLVIVKPSKPAPPELLALSTIDSDPVLNILYPSHVIKEALSKAFVYYYPLAGKIVTFDDGKLGINCNVDGIPFLEATANYELSSLHYLEGIDVPTSQKLVFDDDNPNNSHDHPLVFNVTKFLCGGFTLGMGLSHNTVFVMGLVHLNSLEPWLNLQVQWKK
ncbi:hypothetical protein JHK82_035480 [Glycine max]|nr:hypothetical protein JHK82_035480 [Glycine max]